MVSRILKFLNSQKGKHIKSGLIIFISFPFFIFYIIKNRRFISIRWLSSDVYVFYHTFIRKEFSINLRLENIKYIIDAGANTGLTALYFNNKYPGSKIIAIEPETKNYNLLVKNTKNLNNIFNLKGGVWCDNAFLKLYNPHGSNWGFVTEEVSEDSNFDIRAFSVQTIMKNYNFERIDLFIIDIEGAEKELFNKNTHFWLPKTKYIVIELHGEECESIVKNVLNEFKFDLIYTNGENLYYKNSQL